MLDELYVENLGIISSARIEPGPGLVAVTGETGTGKTLLLGAIRLLKGDAARTDRIGPHGDEARVEGRFTVSGDEIVATRRVGTRSRAYLDGEMVPAKALGARIDDLVEIVGQHEHVSIAREASIRAMVDGLLDSDGSQAAAEYAAEWDRLVSLRAESDAIGGDRRVLARELDLARHQAAEIAAAGLTPGEDVAIHDRLSRLRHAGEITTALFEAARAIEDDGGAADAARSSLALVRGARNLDQGLETIVGQLESAVAELEEVAVGIRKAAEEIDHDPSTLQEAEERAATIADLRRKYGSTVEEVLGFADDLERRIRTLEAAAERAETIATELSHAKASTVAAGERLIAARRQAADRLVVSAAGLLRGLGFTRPFVGVEIDAAPPGPHGADRLTLVFASEDSLTPGPASRVASGGELSRLVLALRVAAGVADADIVAFDEIDAGVGGATALEMGQLLSRLAAGRQVLVVTHLPQIAAYADSHFVVDRVGTSATVRRVEGPDRLAELARMLGGLGESEQGRLHAAELLEVATERRTAG
jgi:DNA repair protein RecN (Recombination protein N)